MNTDLDLQARIHDYEASRTLFALSPTPSADVNAASGQNSLDASSTRTSSQVTREGRLDFNEPEDCETDGESS